MWSAMDIFILLLRVKYPFLQHFLLLPLSLFPFSSFKPGGGTLQINYQRAKRDTTVLHLAVEKPALLFSAVQRVQEKQARRCPPLTPAGWQIKCSGKFTDAEECKSLAHEDAWLKVLIRHFQVCAEISARALLPVGVHPPGTTWCGVGKALAKKPSLICFSGLKKEKARSLHAAIRRSSLEQRRYFSWASLTWTPQRGLMRMSPSWTDEDEPLVVWCLLPCSAPGHFPFSLFMLYPCLLTTSRAPWQW